MGEASSAVALAGRVRAVNRDENAATGVHVLDEKRQSLGKLHAQTVEL
jgi:hypothetical protein